ncbi:MAG: succinylglutamate desuccinylase/aspartoacylase family protein [Bacteroidia bacterium]
MKIHGVYIKKGEHKEISLPVANLPTRTSIDIQVNVFRGKKDGPVLLLMGGMHGDEVNGIEIIRRLIRKELQELVAGTVIAIPILNIHGFINFSREVPDGKDVNRSFPGRAEGSLASRIAFHFMKYIFPSIEYGIDFHTGGASRSNYPQIRYTHDHPPSLELAKVFAPPFILKSRLREGSLRKMAIGANIPLLVYEAGEAMRLDNFAVKEGVAGTVRVLRHLGMTDKKVRAGKSIIIEESRWKRARAAGLFHTEVENGGYVEKNEIVGEISGPFGQFNIVLRSPVAGHIIAVNNKPIIHQGDALLHIGMEKAEPESIKDEDQENIMEKAFRNDKALKEEL